MNACYGNRGDRTFMSREGKIVFPLWNLGMPIRSRAVDPKWVGNSCILSYLLADV